MQVSLNVYDVTNTPNENTNGMICRLNSITRELNLGGVFHGAVQIDEVEWSFGYCESGTGVYCCHARSNSLYTFRENIELGVTRKTRQEIKEILTRFKRTWPGTSYDLLQRNCCHFCEELCAALDVSRPPAWLNRFAQGADATVKFTNEASALAKRVGNNLSITAQQSASWLREMSQRMLAQMSTGTEGADDSAASSSAGDSSPRRWESNPGAHAQPQTVEASFRSEPANAGGRLPSRLRMFAGPALGAPAGGVGCGTESGSGLPSSSHASTSDLQQQGPGAPGQQMEQEREPGQGGLSASQALSVLRQKWQELEATAGDGTKQFLFGLIKTRQTRLDEDDPELFSDVGGRLDTSFPSTSFSPLTSGLQMSRGASGSVGSLGHTGRLAADTVTAPPTQPPTSQIIVHPLLPPEIEGMDASAGRSQAVAAWAAEPPPPPPLLLPEGGQDAAGASVDFMAGLGGAEGGSGSAAAAGGGVGGGGRAQPPDTHLLDT